MIHRSTWPLLPCFAPDAGGDGATPEPDTRALIRMKARVFATEETGIRFESLVLFAEPLFALYDIDQLDAFAMKEEPESADEALVAVLEAARLFWAYFALPAGDQDLHLSDLNEFLLGPDHTPEDEEDLEHLLDRMQDQWRMMEAEERAMAENVEHATLDFAALLAHPVFNGTEGKPSLEGYGPHALSQLEAQALFAQPLLNNAEDPDDIEAALDRASAYWELAHQPAALRAGMINDIVREFSVNEKERREIEEEARRMIGRFDELFPEHRRG